MEVVVTLMSTAALGCAGWAVLQVIKVPAIEEKVNHLVERVDSIHDFLLNSRP